MGLRNEERIFFSDLPFDETATALDFLEFCISCENSKMMFL
jgi:hypothetical protein